MNNSVEVEKNEKGKLIVKTISSELLPFYLNLGWKKKENKTSYQPKPSMVKEEND